jgi:hypothetical protein
MPVRKSKVKPKNELPAVDPKYYRKWVAWSKDGREVIASGDTSDEVHQRVIGLGYNLDQVPFQFVIPPQFYLSQSDEG